MFCVGNSLAHARGRAARRAALRAMAGVLGPGGVLVLTSRNFEQIRAERWGLKVFDHVVVRDGRPGVPIYSWWIAEDWEDLHEFDVAVALIGEDGTVVTPGRAPAVLALLVARCSTRTCAPSASSPRRRRTRRTCRTTSSRRAVRTDAHADADADVAARGQRRTTAAWVDPRALGEPATAAPQRRVA